MAKPDCDDGYYKLSYELAAALLTFGFGEIEGLILGIVLETQYGYGKRKFVELKVSQLAGEWDVDRSNVHRAIGNLVSRNILLSLGDNRYQLLKDYENWDKKGTPGRVLLWKAYVADAPRRAKSLKPLPAPRERDDLILEGMPGVNDDDQPPALSVVTEDNTSDMVDDPAVSSKTTNCCHERQQIVVTKDNTAPVPPGPPIGEARVALRIEEEKKAEQAARVREEKVSPSASIMDDDEPFLPGPDAPAPMTVDWAAVDARIAQVKAAIAKTVANHHLYAGHLEEWCEKCPADWVIKAIEHGAYRGKNQARPQGFVGGLLGNWIAVKGPENDPLYMATRRAPSRKPTQLAAAPNTLPDYLKFADGAVPAPSPSKEQSA